ncbi:toxin glutamine deamidase domain-containing protein [Actinoplanes sp. NPDC049599]|uniref:toxin glutamine deamidase domain-containing protein n=1 Tax=Actinoplanes sp. NPDC049599 TaxID=3363903 RepID=UPI0037A9F3E5
MTILPSPIPHPLDYCPFDVPGWAYEALEWVVGFDWPEGNEKTTWDVADRWYAIAQRLAAPRDEAYDAAGQVLAGYGGTGAGAFKGAWDQLSADPNAPLNSLLAIADELGKLVEECGSDIEGAKLEAWIEIGLFLIELIGMAVAVALTLGAASPAAAGLIAATRMAIQQIFKRLVAQLAKKAIKKSLKEAGQRAAKQLTTKAGLKKLGKEAFKEGFDEMREEIATNGAIQAYQNAGSRGHGFDATELGMSAAGGFAGGFAASGAGIGKGHGGGGGMTRGIGAEVLGEFGGAAVSGDLPGLESVAKSASSGASGSLISGTKAGFADGLADQVANLNVPGGGVDLGSSSGSPSDTSGPLSPVSSPGPGSSSSGSSSAGASGGPLSGSSDPTSSVSGSTGSTAGVVSVSSDGGSGLSSRSSDPTSVSYSAPAASSAGVNLSSLAPAVDAPPGSSGSVAGDHGVAGSSGGTSGGSGSGGFAGSGGNVTSGSSGGLAGMGPSAGVAGSASPAGFSGSASPAGFSGSASPAGLSGSASPAGLSGSAVPAGLPGSASSTGVSGSASPAGPSGVGGASTSAGHGAGGSLASGSAPAAAATSPSTSSTSSPAVSSPAGNGTGVSGAPRFATPAGGLSPWSPFGTDSPSTGTTPPSGTPGRNNPPTPSGVDLGPRSDSRPISPNSPPTATAPSTSPSGTSPRSSSPTAGPSPSLTGINPNPSLSQTGPNPSLPGTGPSPALRGSTPDPARSGTSPNPALPGTTPDPARPASSPNPALPGTTPETALPGTTPETALPGTTPDPALPGTNPNPALPGSNPEPLRPGANPNVALPGTDPSSGRTGPDPAVPAGTDSRAASPAGVAPVSGTVRGSASVDVAPPAAGGLGSGVLPGRTEPGGPAPSAPPRAPLAPGSRDGAVDVPLPAVFLAAGHGLGFPPQSAAEAAAAASEVDDYLRFAEETRANYAANRHRDVIDAVENKARSARQRARSARRSARVARFLKFDPHLAAYFQAHVDVATAEAERAEAEAEALKDPMWRPPRGTMTDVAPQDWHRVNEDRGLLAPSGVSLGNRSMLTGSDHPPSIDSTRRYGSRAGLRAPLAQHQIDLESEVPRDGNGDPVRGADPRAPYFQLVNDGGSEADPTRGINCQDCVLSFFDTYVHGRPRVSAPRTFDAYADGDPARPLYGEDIGPERAEHATGGRFQSLCPIVAGEHPAVAGQRINQALGEVSAQLLAGGHGSFAFLVNAWEGGSAHAWAAVNQNGQILFVDPQSGLVAPPGTPLYGHQGRPNSANVVAVDALVVDGRGNPMPFAGRPDGLWRPKQTTLPPPPPRPAPVYYSAAYQQPVPAPTPLPPPTPSPLPAPSPGPTPSPAPLPSPAPPLPAPDPSVAVDVGPGPDVSPAPSPWSGRSSAPGPWSAPLPSPAPDLTPSPGPWSAPGPSPDQWSAPEPSPRPAPDPWAAPEPTPEPGPAPDPEPSPWSTPEPEPWSAPDPGPSSASDENPELADRSAAPHRIESPELLLADNLGRRDQADPRTAPDPRPGPTPPAPAPNLEPAIPPNPIPSPRRPVDRIAEALAPRPAPVDRIAEALAPRDPQRAVNLTETAPALDQALEAGTPEPAPEPDAERARWMERVRQAEHDARERKSYREYLEHARATHEDNRRAEYADYLMRIADGQRAKVLEIGMQADTALASGATLRGEHLRAEARRAGEDADDFEDKARRVRAGEFAPERIDVEPADWYRINDDVGTMALGGVETGDRSALTGDGVPPPVDQSRPYGRRGGLRAPLAVHQMDLENAMPRAADGRVVRLADPRTGHWFALANDGGPAADPTRGINCVDGVLSLYETYVHGRPRVSAPRTFDAYAQGDPTRPLGAEENGLARVEDTVQGEFQGLCPYVGGLSPLQAKQAVDTAMTNLHNHLYNAGHGAFAFIVTDSEQGTAHAWAAVNQNGTILFLDPQTGRLSEEAPLYTHLGEKNDGNVISMDALVVNGQGEPSPLPYHGPGLWSRSSLQPTGISPETGDGGPEDQNQGRTPSSPETDRVEPDSSSDRDDAPTLQGAQDLTAAGNTAVSEGAADVHEPRGRETDGQDQQPISPIADAPHSGPLDDPHDGSASGSVALTESQLAEKALLDSLTGDEREALVRSRDDSLQVARAVLRDLENVVSGREIPQGSRRPEIVDTKHLVKEVSSLARKYVDARIFGRTSVSRFLESVNDRVRFSVEMPVDQYGERVADILDGLTQRGYAVTVPDDIKNFWRPGNRHLGLNVTVRNPDGFVLEIQFPTATSRALGKNTHELYEDLRLPGSSPEKRVESLLGILRWNREFRINEQIPRDLSGLPTSIDTSFLRWTEKNPIVWQQYLSGLPESQSFRDVVSNLGLQLEDFPGGERLGLGDDDGDVRVPRSGDGERRSAAGEPDRGVDRAGPTAPGGPVEPSGPELDLRAGGGGPEAVRRSVPGDGAAGGPEDRGADSQDGAEHGPAGTAGAAPDVPGRRGDGSDLGTAPQLTSPRPADGRNALGGPQLSGQGGNPGQPPAGTTDEDGFDRGSRSDEADGRPDVRLSGGLEVGHVRNDLQPDRVPGDPGQPLPSGDLQRSAEGVDLRPGAGSADALRRQVPGSPEAGRPGDGRADRPGGAAHGSPERGDPAGDDRGRRTDGLDLRPTSPVENESSPSPADDRPAIPRSLLVSEMVAEDFDPRAAEERQLAALESEHRAIIEESVDQAVHDAARLQVTLEAVVRSVNEASGLDLARLVGVENSFKTKSSLARAFAAEYEAEGMLPADFLEKTKDRVRFSIQLPEVGYEANALAALTELRGNGHTVKKVVNFWRGDGRHNGLNTTVIDPEGVVYELQFPTELSRAIGDQTHLLYEVVRHPEAPTACLVDAFLRIVAINKREGIADRLPDSLSALTRLDGVGWKDVDSTFQNWVANNDEEWESYLRDLQAEGSSFDRILDRTGLSRADVLDSMGSDDDDRPAARLPGDPEVRLVGGGDERDRVRDSVEGNAPSGDVERAPEGVDLRSTHGRDFPEGPQLSGENATDRPDRGRENRPGVAPVGTTDGTGAPGDVRRGQPDGLGVRAAPRVADGTSDQTPFAESARPALFDDHGRAEVGLVQAAEGSVSDVRLSGIAEHGRATEGDQPDRLFGSRSGAAASGDVARGPEAVDLRPGDSGGAALRRGVLGRDGAGRPGDRGGDGEGVSSGRPSERRDPSGDDRRGGADELGLRPAVEPGETVATNAGPAVINSRVGQTLGALGDAFELGAHYLDLFEYGHERRQAQRLGDSYDVRALDAAHGRTDDLGNPDVILRADAVDPGAYGDLKRLDPDLQPNRKDADYSRRVEKRLREPFGQDPRITVAVVDGRDVGLTIDAAVRGIRRALGFWRQQGREVGPEQRMIVFTGDGGSVVWRGDTGDINVSA